MFEQVSDQIDALVDGLSVPQTEEALVWAFALVDRVTARALDAAGGFDAAEAWREAGATSMTAWLRDKARQSSRDARRNTSISGRLSGLPVTAAAMRDGSLSAGQVQAITVNLNKAIAPSFAAAEIAMVPLLVPLSVADVARVMQAWAQAARDDLQDDPAGNDDGDSDEGGDSDSGDRDGDGGVRGRSLYLSATLDGRGELSGSLDAEGRALLECALRVADSDDADGEPPRTPSQRRADALLDICRFYLDNQQTARGGRHRPHLNVFVAYEDLVTNGGHHSRGGWLADGTHLDGATIQRLACDAGIHRIVTTGRSSILDYGYAHQAVPVNLFNALVARDRRCRFPGCDRPPKWTEAHHVRWWTRHGPTEIGNLLLLCSRHHHVLHMPGWHIKLLPDATVEVTRPDGQVLIDPPPGRLDNLFADSG